MKLKTISCFLLVFFTALGSRSESAQIYIAFRNDDISIKSEPKFEYEVIRIFQKYNIKPLYAVIPKIEGKSLAVGMPIVDSLKSWLQKGWIDIAMHGYTHEGKFAGLTLEEQIRRIKKGKEIITNLIDISPKYFCPPWNSADINTLKAVRINNINYFSGYLGEETIEDLSYINCNCNLFDGPLGSLKYVLNIALNSNKYILLIPLFHTSYDFDNNSFNKLDSLLNFITQNRKIKIVSFTELKSKEYFRYILTQSNIAGYKIKLLEQNKFINKIFYKIPFLTNFYANKKEMARKEYFSGDYNEAISIYDDTIYSVYLIIGMVIFISVVLPVIIFSKPINKSKNNLL